MKVIAFASGKGGVGKTRLAFLLGLVLQRAGCRVAFLDQASLPTNGKMPPRACAEAKTQFAIMFDDRFVKP